MASITLNSVTKRYRDGTLAVRGVDLEIADGEFMILVGPSGCGKTTLLRMIAGLEAITDGEVLVDDVVVNDLTPRKRDMAMVFQNYALYPHMTVAKNMGFALRRQGVPAEEIRRAIVRDPTAFLMDEPLSNLDAKLRIQTRAEILRIQRRLRTTTVYVTHDQTEAMTLGDRLAVMRDGVLQQVGTPDDLYNHPRNVFVGGFIGAPAMNFLPGEITSGSLKFALATIPLDDVRNAGERVTQGDGHVLVGIRPEDFEDAALAGERGHGIRIRAMIDVLESTGSDRYAHLAAGEHNGSHEPDESLLRELKAMAFESGDDITPTSLDVIARVDASSRLGEGKEGELWLDTTKLHLFDPATG